MLMKSCIDLFCGAGGFAEGFRKAGFEVLVATDHSEIAALTYKKNHPKVKFILKDIYALDGVELLESSGLKQGEVDVIIGGPDCQGFSTIGKRSSGDPRNTLFKEYVRIVEEIKPKMFVMENVKGILSLEKGQVLADILKSFSDIGYRIVYRVLNAKDYGVPQSRERVIFIGTRMDLNISIDHILQIDKTNVSSILPLTLWDAIGDLPVICSGEHSSNYDKVPQSDYQKQRRNGTEELTLHIAAEHSPEKVKMMSYIAEGSSAWETQEMPLELRPQSGFANSYARLSTKVPGMTITRNFSCISSARCIHPFSDRGLTAREAARIQSFDDNYVFLGSKTDIARQLGNAVPPLFAKGIGLEIIKAIGNN